jgi:Acyl-CoA dehydrogenase, C-terminal domain
LRFVLPSSRFLLPSVAVTFYRNATTIGPTKHVANTLRRVIGRAIQVHGALGYSTDTPLDGMMRNARSA